MKSCANLSLGRLWAAALAGAGFVSAAPAADFDGDGYDDWVVGSPYEDNGILVDAGCLTVDYSSAASDQFYGNESGDQFGYAMAIGNFNGDFYDDVAVGVPAENSASGRIDSGAVIIYYGSAGGLGNPEYLDQDTLYVVDSCSSGDFFGHALASGDFDADGYEDLAVGVHGQDVGGAVVNAGAVHIFYGSSDGFIDGLTGFVDNRTWDQNSTGILGVAQASDFFGWALASGDFDGDFYDDLAIGVPYEDYGAIDDGAVNVLYGSSSGLTATGDELFGQAAFGGTAENGDAYGFTLVAGDFGVGNDDDLAIGGPYEDRGTGGSILNAGAIGVLYGNNGLSSPAASEFLAQDVTDVEGGAETNDYFGMAMAVGWINSDSTQELVVGIRYEDAGGAGNAGMIQVFYSNLSNGFINTAAAEQVVDQVIWQSKAGYSGASEANDYMGASVAVCDLNGDGYDDVIAGVPGEEGTGGGDPANAGYVHKIYGSVAGLSTTDVLVREGSGGLIGIHEANDQFGTAACAR